MLTLLCLLTFLLPGAWSRDLYNGNGGAAPVFIETPGNVTVGPGTNLEMKCVATGSPKPQVMIIRELYASEPILTLNHTADNGLRTMVTYSMLDDIKVADSGIYACVAANIYASIKQEFQILVKDLCAGVSCSENQNCVADYETLTVSCQCPQCTSVYDPVCGSNCRRYHNVCMFRTVNCEQGTNYTVAKDWVCRGAQKVPIIRRQPQDTITKEGSPFRIKCQVSGSNVKIQWYKDGELADATGELLHIKQSKVEDAGVYHCVASNCDGVNAVESTPANLIVIKDTNLEFGPSCSVFGGTHIVTFDQFTYSFQGSCTYALSVDCSRGLWYVYGTFYPCAVGAASSCLREITIVHGRDYVTLGGDRVISVNGYYRDLTHDLPFELNGLTATLDNQAGMLEVVLQSQVKILWDGVQGITILVPNGETDVCGLCSNNDGNMANENTGYYFDNTREFLNMVEFANQYRIDPECDSVVKAEDQCSVDLPNSECDTVFDNPVFIKGCRPVNGIRQFFKGQCYIDTCRAAQQGEDKKIACQLGKSFSTWCYHNKGNPESWTLFTECNELEL